MKNKYSIDELFKRAFKNFEQRPDASNWEAIERELNEERKRRAVVFWYRLSGIAAVLLITVLAGLYFWSNQSLVAPAQDVVFENENNTPQHKTAPLVLPQEFIYSSGAALPITYGRRLENTAKKPYEKNAKKEANILSDRGVVKSSPQSKSAVTSPSSKRNAREKTKTNANKLTPVASSPKTQDQASGNSKFETPVALDESNPETGLVNSSPKDTAGELDAKKEKSLLAVAEKQKEQENREESNREKRNEKHPLWRVKPNVSPVFYNSLGGNNVIDQRFDQNSSKADVTISYGINVAFAVTDRVKIRSGVNRVNMSYNTRDVRFSSALNAAKLSGVKPTQNTQNIEVLGQKSKKFERQAQAGISNQASKNAYAQGDLNQQMGFIEVPVEIEYSLIDSRLGLNVIGGASTLFLNGNQIQIESKYGTTELGESSKLNKTSFSANFGLGLTYNLSSRFDLSLEPTFKYQINTFEGTDFKPYFMGVYTGVSFKL